MGRYVYGDFEYKFAFARQGSNLGEALQEIVDSDEEGYAFFQRYIGDDGEILKLTIHNGKEFAKFIKQYIDNRKDATEGQESYYDALMMQKFLTDLEIEEGGRDDITLNFEVEY